MSPRLWPVLEAVNRATPDLDVGIPATQTGFGLVVCLVAFALAMFWRITTPLSALEPIGSDAFGQRPSAAQAHTTINIRATR